MLLRSDWPWAHPLIARKLTVAAAQSLEKVIISWERAWPPTSGSQKHFIGHRRERDNKKGFFF
jgi:hypothetical protein